MCHRGPDERSYYETLGASLGIARLKVIGLEHGRQPTFNRDQTVVCVFNGEIYNHRKLRRRLERAGHQVTGNSDASVIPVLFEVMGLRFVDELEGMYAIAIYDTRQRRLHLITDRVGKKPICYSVRDGAVLFASELHALTADQAIDDSINMRAIDQYLSYRIIPAPETIYQKVHKVMPATVLTFEPGRAPSAWTYWRFDFAPTTNAPKSELVRNISALLETAVGERLEADVPLGAMLSGGLDSSLVTAIASQKLGRRLRTFSVGFHQEAFDETAYARLVAERYSVEHYCHTISPEDAIAAIDPILYHVGEPYAFPSAIACYYMYRIARERVTVVLTGDGSDEIFCGYNRYKVFNRALNGNGGNGNVADTYEVILSDGLARSLKTQLYGRQFRLSVPEPFPVNYLDERFRRSDSRKNALNRVLEVDSGFWLPDAQLVKIDRMAMAHSVEPRSPMLDHRLIEYVMGIDPRLMLDGDNEKILLKEVAAYYLPEPVVTRKKQELAVPLEHWLAHELRPLIQTTLLSEASLSRGYFHPDRLRELVTDFPAQLSYATWTLFMLERWHQLFVDREAYALEAQLR
jgi:asparagine synthase (glutamine-hydrolysing)